MRSSTNITCRVSALSGQHAVSDSQTKLQSFQSLISSRLFNLSVCHSVYFRTHFDSSGSEAGALNLLAIVSRLGTRNCSHLGKWSQGVASSAMPLAMLAP